MKELTKVYRPGGIIIYEEIEIPEDPAPDPAPTELDRLEAQVVYTAMMTDTLLEEG